MMLQAPKVCPLDLTTETCSPTQNPLLPSKVIATSLNGESTTTLINQTQTLLLTSVWSGSTSKSTPHLVVHGLATPGPQIVITSTH